MRGSWWLNRRIEQRFRVAAISTVKSLKIKLLLCTCVALTLTLTLITFSTTASSFFQWTSTEAFAPRQGTGSRNMKLSEEKKLKTLDKNRIQTLSLLNPKDTFDQIRKGYSIVMNTWKRYDLLKQSIQHYSSCPRLESVHIVWSEPDPPSDSLIKRLHHVVRDKSKDGRQVKLKFDINKEDSLNNRFKEIKDLETDAVFSIDDDVLFSCSSVEFAFDVWQSAPDTMVGFVPRAHWKDSLKGDGYKFKYSGWWSVWWTGTYSMVLSKAAFFHKKYFILYTNQMPASIKEYITKNRNCEDIAMSFLVANATGAPPIWVKGKIFEIGSTGISSLGGHIEKRSECVNKFVAVFGRMPLVSTSAKAIDSRNIWFW